MTLFRRKPAVVIHTGTIVRPGDHVVLRATGRMTAELADRFAAEFKRALPGVERVVVLSDIDEIAVYRPLNIAPPPAPPADRQDSGDRHIRKATR